MQAGVGTVRRELGWLSNSIVASRFCTFLITGICENLKGLFVSAPAIGRLNTNATTSSSSCSRFLDSVVDGLNKLGSPPWQTATSEKHQLISCPTARHAILLHKLTDVIDSPLQISCTAMSLHPGGHALAGKVSQNFLLSLDIALDVELPQVNRVSLVITHHRHGGNIAFAVVSAAHVALLDHQSRLLWRIWHSQRPVPDMSDREGQAQVSSHNTATNAT